MIEYVALTPLVGTSAYIIPSFALSESNCNPSHRNTHYELDGPGKNHSPPLLGISYDGLSIMSTLFFLALSGIWGKLHIPTN